jgi:biotin transport system substrate-specific component
MPPMTSPKQDFLPRTGSHLRPMVYTALFVALISVGAFIAIPIGPVPIVLQNLFVLLAGLILGPAWGTACVGVYLLVGLAGLPVFAGGTSGIGKLFGPTGGYLLGYLPAVWITGAISSRLKISAKDILALIAGTVVIYAAGVPWLKIAFSLSWGKAVSAGMIPFLAGDAVKIVAAAVIAKQLRPMIRL